MFFNQQGKQFFLTIGKFPNGPTYQYLVEEYNTLDDVRLLGNALVGSRAVINFGQSFDQNDMRKVEKSIWTDILNTPKNHPKSQPFVDKVMSLDYYENQLQFRLFQIRKEDIKGERLDLVEIGPRMSLQLIRVAKGSMTGETLYKNQQYLTPTILRHQRKNQNEVKKQQIEKKIHKKHLVKESIKDLREQDESIDEFLADDQQQKFIYKCKQKDIRKQDLFLRNISIL